TLKTTPSKGLNGPLPPRKKRGAAISSWPSGATATEQMGHGRPQNPDGAVLDRSCPVRTAGRGRAACCSRSAKATAEPSRTKPQGWATATRGRLGVRRDDQRRTRRRDREGTMARPRARYWWRLGSSGRSAGRRSAAAEG